MLQRTQKIYAIYDAIQPGLARQDVDFDKEKVNQLIANIYSPGPSFQHIFNFSTRDFSYVSSSIQDVLGYDPTTFSMNEFLGIIHPDDFEHARRSEELAGHFYMEFIDPELIPFYKKSYQFRMRDAQGNYHMILHQSIAIAMTHENQMSITLGNQSIIDHISKVNNYKMSFIDIRGGKSYTNISAIEDLEAPLKLTVSISQREVEVLRCISEGMKNEEIAAELNISSHTVRTHRNNILKNYHFKTIPEAITYCVREGLL